MSDKNLTLPILSDVSVISVGKDRKTKAVMPSMSPPSAVAKVTGVSPASLSAQLEGFVRSLEKMVNGVPDTCGSYDVEELTFALSIDGLGKVSLLGQLSSGVRSSITLKLKKRRTES